MKKTKALTSFAAVICIICLLASSLPFAASAANLKLNADEVTIYALDGDKADMISIPEDMPQSFTFEVEGASDTWCSCYELAVDGMTVSPKVDTWYWYGYVGQTTENEGVTPDRITKDVDFGDKTAWIYADGVWLSATVHVVDYAKVYAENVARAYLDENITENMTTEDKLKVIAKFAADRDYSVNYQSFEDMVIYGGGDCWASTNTIVAMSKMIGLDAWIRNGNRDAGAGSGHRNAMVTDGTDYYVVEAGYYMSAPRPYTVTKRSSLFSFRYKSDVDGYEVYQYDGKEMPAVLEIPTEYNGKPVVSVGDGFIVMEPDVEEVILPETISYIGQSAFNSCENLRKINIPQAVEDIGNFAFVLCSQLTDVQAQGSIRFENGAFIKDNTRLIYVLNPDRYTVPEGVTSIDSYAFAHNPTIREISIASTVESIGEGCFYNCPELKTVSVKSNALTSLGKYVFASNGVDMVYLPPSLTEIDSDVATGVDKMTVIGYRGSAAEAFAAANDNISFIAADDFARGDVNLDGKTDVRDVTTIQRYLAEIETLCRPAIDNGDYNGDHELQAGDATSLQRILAEFDD